MQIDELYNCLDECLKRLDKIKVSGIANCDNIVGIYVGLKKIGKLIDDMKPDSKTNEAEECDANTYKSE